MLYAIDDALTLTDEIEHRGLARGVFVLVFREKIYGPTDRVPEYKARAAKLVAAWALGARGRRTDAERGAALCFLASLPPRKPGWTFPNPGALPSA